MYSKVWNRRSPWNKRSRPLKNVYIRILIQFYINQGIAVIFHRFKKKKSKNVPLYLFRTLEHLIFIKFSHKQKCGSIPTLNTQSGAFGGTGFLFLGRLGSRASTEKKFWADYEQLLMADFHVFRGKFFFCIFQKIF